MSGRAISTTGGQPLLPALDVGQPAQTLFLPRWLDSKMAVVPTTGRPTIPESLILSQPERDAVLGRIEAIDQAMDPGPGNLVKREVAKILTFYANGASSEAQMTVKIAVWMEALEDLPAWAVQEAVRRWFRGDMGDTAFAPSTKAIRTSAEHVMRALKGQGVALRRLLVAEPEKEFTDAHRARMLEKLGSIFPKEAAASDGAAGSGV